MTDHTSIQAGEAAIGAVAELSKRGGAGIPGYHAHGYAKAGELVVSGAATLAPGAVAALSSGTATVVAGATAVAAAAAPILVAAAVGYGVFKLVEWLSD